MSKRWLINKQPDFVRDVFRDFCFVHQSLEEHFLGYDDSEEVSFEFMRSLLGEEMNKGLLWRLKDTAHLLFRSEPDIPVMGTFLDWGIGYIFHESMKLKEDAYQRQNYGPWFDELKAQNNLDPEEEFIGKELYQVVLQTRESIQREIGRIRFILYHCRRMFILFLAKHAENHLLARFIYDRNELVKSVFKGSYDELIDVLYLDTPEKLFLYASRSLRQGGWMQDASVAIDQAVKIAPQNVSVLQEKEIIDKWRLTVRNRLT